MGISYGNRVIFHVIQLTSALHIQRQKTLQARNRQILAIRLARCAVSDLEKWYCLSEKLYTKSLAPSKTVTIKTLWIRSRRFFFSETRSRLHPIPEQHSVFNHHLSQGVSTLDIPRIFNITESAHRIHNPVSYTHLDVYKRQVPLPWRLHGNRRRTLELSLIHISRHRRSR